MLMDNRLLVHYNPKHPVILACDASPVGVGAVLSHIMPNGDERPIAYASETLSETQRNYSQIEKEAYAIIFGVKKFYAYLYGNKFTLITDHKPLAAIFGPKRGIPILAVSRLQRWALLLSSFQYDIRYRKTEEHANADTLSRLPNADATKQNMAIDDSILEIKQILAERLQCILLTADKVAVATEKDKILKQAMNLVPWHVQSCWPSKAELEDKQLLPLHQRQNELWIENDCLYWNHRVIIPESLKMDVLKLLHEGHLGVKKTIGIARQYVWWSGIDQDIEHTVAGCANCNPNKNMPKDTTVNHKWEMASKQWERLHIDYAGPFLGHQWLVVVDAYTKWPEVFKVPAANTANTLIILRSLIARFGIPDEVVSDNGTPFTSAEFKKFCDDNGILHTLVAPYHPQSNGQAERFVQTFKKMMKVNSETNLDLKLSQVLFQYRTAPHSGTGKSPALAMFGRQLKTRLDFLKKNPKQTKFTNTDLSPGFEIHARVWARNYGGIPKWIPGKIKEKIGKHVYVVEVNGQMWKRHKDQIRKYADDMLNKKPIPAEFDDDDDWMLFNKSQDDTNPIVEHSQRNTTTAIRRYPNRTRQPPKHFGVG